MVSRKRALPSGWYPQSGSEAERVIRQWEDQMPAPVSESVSVIVPHAGWGYSGKLAFETLTELSASAETFIVVGGHLPKNAGVYCAAEDEFHTPLGPYGADTEFAAELERSLPAELSFSPDTYADNTVEIQLPLLKYLHPESRCVWLRMEPTLRSKALGAAIHETAERLHRSVRVVGSTDLTHYGAAYGYSPAGTGLKAVEWAESRSDARIIKAYCEMDFDEALQASEEDRSSCSFGGASTAMAFAECLGVRRGRAVRYLNSYRVRPSDSFVGYVGICY